MPYQFDIEMFNAGDKQHYDLFYALRFKTVLIYAKYKTHNEDKAWIYAHKAFQELKNHNPKNFTSLRNITEWLKQTVSNYCLIYDSGKTAQNSNESNQ